MCAAWYSPGTRTHFVRYNDVLSEDVSAELFNRMAIEIMKAVNFYNYNNRERSLRRIYLCGGGVAVDQIRAAICRVTDLDVHNAEELLPQHDALEAAWLYIKAIGCAAAKVRRRWNEA